MADQQNTIKTTVELDSDDAQQRIQKFGNKASKSMDQVAKSTDEVAKSTEGLGNSSGKAKKGIEALDNASGGLLTSFKALATNPVGLILTALVGIFATLKAAVGRSGKATETFNKIGAKLSGIFNGILAILEPVVEFLGDKLLSALNDPKQAMIDLGNSIKENIITRFEGLLKLGGAVAALFKGDFKKAGELAKEGLLEVATGTEDVIGKLKEFGKEAVKNYNEAAIATDKLANAERQLVRNRIALEKQQLISLRLAEEQRQIRDDESKSIEERIAANKRLGEILDQQAQRELAIAQQNLNLARLEQQASGDTIENIEAVGDAEIALLEIRERITGQRSEQLVNENSLLKEQAELKQAEVEEQLKLEEEAKAKEQEERELKEEQRQRDIEAQLELDEIELQRKRDLGEATLEDELAFLEAKRLQAVSQEGLRLKEIEVINQQAENAKEKMRKASEKAEKEKEEAVLNNAINSAVEAFGIAQEVAVARMIMAAPEAVAGSFKEAAKSYAPPLSLVMGALGAAGTVAPIIKGLGDIKKARFSKSKGGSTGGSINTSISARGSETPSSITPEVVSDIASNNSARLGLDSSIGDNATASASNNIRGGSSNDIVFSEAKYSEFQNQVEFKENKTTI